MQPARFRQADFSLVEIDQFSASNNRPHYEALGNKYRVCGVYSPEPRSAVYCLRVNFNISKLVYSSAFGDEKLMSQISAPG